MTTDKPSKNEDEYFAHREAEILKARRDTAARAAEGSERRSHFMRCPNCGGHLKTETYHEIRVERCPDCLGVWFDAAQAETLMHTESSRFASIFGALVRGVHLHGKTPNPA
jgi:Zn-finger nucleic acid-binding protein